MKYWGSVNVVEKRHGGDCYGSQRDGFETIVYEHIRAGTVINVYVAYGLHVLT